MLASVCTLAVAQAAKSARRASPYDTCTCPINGTASYPLGLIQFECPFSNVATPLAPVTGRVLWNNKTNLCQNNHCCEYTLGKKPRLAPDASLSRGQAALLVSTWVLMATCGVVGTALYMLQPCLVRHFVHADVRRQLLTLVSSLLGAVGFSLGSDLLLYSTAISQVCLCTTGVWLRTGRGMLHIGDMKGSKQSLLLFCCCNAQPANIPELSVINIYDDDDDF